MHKVVKRVFILAEMSDLVQAVDDEKQQAEGQADCQGGNVEGTGRILGGEESFHVDLGFSSKIDISAISKEMLIYAVFHKCLERSLAEGKIIRIFSTLGMVGVNTNI
jgi:hypothetical protein